MRRFFSGTLLSRFSGLAREVMMAFAFGTSSSVAAFWMAFRFAHLMRRIFGEGALHAAFVPHFEALRAGKPKSAAHFFFDLLTGVALVLVLITCFSEMILGGILLFCPISEGTVSVIRLTMYLLPALVFICLYALNTSLLNCEKTFFWPSVAPAFLNCVWVAAVYFLWRGGLQNPMEKLSMILVFAFALQWLVTLPQVYRYLSHTLGRQWRAEKSISSKEILALLHPFFLGLIGVTATQINSALDAIFARLADPEGPAYLWYALRIQQLPLALFGVGLTGALLPPLTRAVQGQDKSKALFFLNFALRRVAVLMIPMTVGIGIVGFLGVSILYGHGAFTSHAISETSSCLWAYGLGLFPMTSVLILAAAFYARKDYKTPAFISLSTVALNIGFNALFVFGFHGGAVSIAIATSLTAFVNSLLLAYVLWKRGDLTFEGLSASFIKVTSASLLAAAFTALASQMILNDPVDFSGKLIHFAFKGGSFSILFIGLAYLFKLKDFFDLLPSLAQKRIE